MANDDTNNVQAHDQPPEPNPDLKNLDRLVGTWRMSEEVSGTVTYEWMEGGFFLIQRVDLEQYGEDQGHRDHRPRTYFRGRSERGH